MMGGESFLLNAALAGVAIGLAGVMLRPVTAAVKWSLLLVCPYGVILAIDLVRGIRQGYAAHKAAQENSNVEVIKPKK